MKIYLADLLTGRRIIPLPHTSAEWEMKLNDTDSLTVKVPIYASSATRASNILRTMRDCWI